MAVMSMKPGHGDLHVGAHLLCDWLANLQNIIAQMIDCLFKRSKDAFHFQLINGKFLSTEADLASNLVCALHWHLQ